MKITHIRHASHIIEFKNKMFLVDPVFAEKGSMASLPMGRVSEKNPLVPMPFVLNLNLLDGIFITHTHFDHFDDRAQEILPRDIQIFCSPFDEKKIKKSGFTNITPIHHSKIIYDGIMVKATTGKHGTGLCGKLMGKISGFVIRDTEKIEPTIYIVGDSIWYDYISDVVSKEKPDVIITFAGEARLIGKPITMSIKDIDCLANISAKSKIVAIHMDTWNHCYLTRNDLKEFLKDKNYKDRIIIPKDGETIVF